jgi:hypothetical protein
VELDVDHDFRVDPPIRHPADLGDRPVPALAESADEALAPDMGESSRTIDSSLASIANEIRAQHAALDGHRPAPKRRRTDIPAAAYVPPTRERVGLRWGAAVFVLALSTASVSLNWMPANGRTPANVHMPRDFAWMLSPAHEGPSLRADKPPTLLPRPPSLTRQAFPLIQEMSVVGPISVASVLAPAAAPPAAEAPQRVVTRAETALRAQPDIKASLGRVLPGRVILTVFQRKDDWVEVGSSYAWGWVHSSFVYSYNPSSG